MSWSEDSSEKYRKLAAVAVPDRAEQMATLLTLLPFGRNEAFRAVELASGEGLMAHTLLSSFPNANLLALDGSESMREETAHNLQAFADRITTADFDMHSADWHHHLQGADCVYSSLCIHHLDGDEKQALFAAVANKISERGVFLIADLILPQRREANALFAATWDRSAEAQAAPMPEAYQFFLETGWNYYRYPDDFDKPSPLYHQLTWLHAAGFAVVDCFWMKAGHAIYGGYKSAAAHDIHDTVTYAEALHAAESALAKVR